MSVVRLIPVLDRIIVGRYGYYSFSDRQERSEEGITAEISLRSSKMQNVVG